MEKPSATPADDEVGRLGRDLTAGLLTPEGVWVAAYLGYRPARDLLDAKAPAVFTLQSMRLGGDNHWRRAMRALGPRPPAFAACEIARMAADIYFASPDSPPEVNALAREAVDIIASWKRAPRVELMTLLVKERCPPFFLAVDVGGAWSREAGPRGRGLGTIVGHCYGVLLGWRSRSRRYVRSFGDMADRACRFGVSEAEVTKVVAEEMIPFALGRAR